MKTLTAARNGFRVEWMIFSVGLVFSLYLLALSFGRPLLDQYSFRQTQTAISVYWLLKGGPWVAYQTPVLGAPWSIPFEFPVYQWLVAIAARLMPFLTLDDAGRVVSEAFFIGTLWPLWRIASHLPNGRTQFLIGAGILMLSPLYAFWARSFMMESAALFFAVWFIAAELDFFASPSASGVAEMTLTAVLAALIKITTFVGFSFAGGLIAIFYLRRNFGTTRSLRSLVHPAMCVFAVAASVVMLWLWVSYSDGLKSANLIGSLYTGKALEAWNFGSVAQRKSLDLLKVIAIRAPGEAVGSWLVALIFSVVAVIQLNRRQLAIYFAMLFLYVAPFFVFTNLHLVHHYYQFANSIFLVLALSYVAASLIKSLPLATLGLLAILVGGDLYAYSKDFANDLVLPNRQIQMMLASDLRNATRPDEVVVGFGLQWSSEVPYYSTRRSLLIPDNVGANVLHAVAADLMSHTGYQPVGGVVVCPNQLGRSPATLDAYENLMHTITKDLKPHTVGTCLVYSRS